MKEREFLGSTRQVISLLLSHLYALEPSISSEPTYGPLRYCESINTINTINDNDNSKNDRLDDARLIQANHVKQYLKTALKDRFNSRLWLTIQTHISNNVD
ncbi:hypothetical protein BDP55DRAFT_678483 [Colletotrichum godetiae]|uniref:Uncharacterized protein n=1 Tax=Colletotrichum godetiae TaxID=1209918 RepID=A0AAJ0AAV1_9PEZI|nr:uncharacterized protein BDP55DRAFT_678483 [Colletotrichum godetiae]KAK1659803.1 hypothetical protein BDP55DRAFT_678483 [Colletotrichum godetiae]